MKRLCHEPRWGGRLYELFERVPRRPNMDARRFNVITWIAPLTTIGTTWQREHRRAAKRLPCSLR